MSICIPDLECAGIGQQQQRLPEIANLQAEEGMPQRTGIANLQAEEGTPKTTGIANLQAEEGTPKTTGNLTILTLA
jgi:hypothetical protein